ncbi:uncharacterized protein FIBRA_02181 [Fibroporia radiculosa]|uniref:PH domain-containing protein n=1 Tax=Fibroporia radiculosa TaxID=599839 RepID=J4G1E3_9APHY|nr:uncharacterized protein FIBRA_02181 [Fibroporia radiculosa]CCM00153.1 predicted protein [Fibroporia radiculosa]
MSAGLPLRDRLQSNEEDNGWLSRPITPLRIAKRDSPQQGTPLARRTSSSYKHLKHNHLVSKSPFRSQIPTPARPSTVLAPAPRRVSGEKRPRPPSMIDQAENEHPLGFKRRQSKGFQGLLQKEPVTKSPFRHGPSADAELDLPPPPPPPKVLRGPPISASPGRSSLVSKRLHGPRTVGNGSLTRRQRRKTVTFDERCDVVEFDVEEDEIDENPFDSEDSEDEVDSTGDLLEPPPTESESFDSLQLGDDSITGLVDSMLNENPQTPPHESQSLPPDTEAEDGVPYGRTHHAERILSAHHQNTEEVLPTTESISPAAASSPPPLTFSSTPPRATSPGLSMPLGRSTHSERRQAQRRDASDGVDEDVLMLPPSPSPAKRIGTLPCSRANRESLIPRMELPVPSPRERTDVSAEDPFELPHNSDEPLSTEMSRVVSYDGDSSMDPANLSIGNSEVSLDGVLRDDDVEEDPKNFEILSESHRSSLSPDGRGVQVEGNSSRPSTPLNGSESSALSTFSGFRFTSPIPRPRSNSPRFYGDLIMPRATRSSESLIPERVGSPLRHAAATMSLHDLAAIVSGTPENARFSRATFTAKGADRSPNTPEKQSEVDRPPSPQETKCEGMSGDRSFKEGDTESFHSPAPPPMSRDNHASHDGVVSIHTEPQAIDPPRPSVLARANTADEQSKYAFEGLRLDFEDGFTSSGKATFLDMEMSALGRGEVHLTDVSALDRFVESVAHGVPAGSQSPEDKDMTNPWEKQSPQSASGSGSASSHAHWKSESGPLRPESRAISRDSSASPPPRSKDAIRARDELIKAKKREARRREEQEALGVSVSARVKALHVGRPTRKRSMSMSDADAIGEDDSEKGKGKGSEFQLDDLPLDSEEDRLGDTIDRELRIREGLSKSRYRVREREGTIYASSETEKVSHLASAGDVDGGKAWKTVKRPSDMNEYAKQIRELRAQENSGKGHGKIFVRVLGLKNLVVPIPQQPTAMTCTLNNGIHFVTTPESRLSTECRIDQEFELIEHSKLEFTLTIRVRRDPHITAQLKANVPPLPPSRPAPLLVQPAPAPASKGGMRMFFRGSPKKPMKQLPQTQPLPVPSPPPVHRMTENLARYLKSDCTLARAFISFRDISTRCDTKLFETSYPLIGQRAETSTVSKTIQVGELVLQVFRLPPLPGVPNNQLPQSLEECHRGLRHIGWHKTTYYEGTLTQNGGDCQSWRRRHLRLTGANLIAFNDVTKRAIATIDLKKAIAVEDRRDPRITAINSASGAGNRSGFDELDGPYGVERSFRLVFPANQEIMFFADTDEEMARWLDILRAIVGRIPPYPLWAELVWQRQQETHSQAGYPQSQPVPLRHH